MPLVAILLAAGVGLAHAAAATPPTGDDGGSAAGPSNPTRHASAYEALGRDDRAIAMILFLAQFKATDRDRADAPALWSLEKIAGARLRWAGWGQVFHDLYSASLVDSESLARILAMRGPAARDAIRAANDHR